MGICGEESALLIVKKFNKTISCEKVIYIEDTYQINLNFPRGIVGRRSAGCIGPLNFLIWIAPFLDTEVHSSGALPQNSLTGLTETKSIMEKSQYSPKWIPHHVLPQASAKIMPHPWPLPLILVIQRGYPKKLPSGCSNRLLKRTIAQFFLKPNHFYIF
jgi:hypothetical protein